MMKMIIGALIMYVYLQHPGELQGGFESVRETLVSALDWISTNLKS
jgi:hypothetical protein